MLLLSAISFWDDGLIPSAFFEEIAAMGDPSEAYSLLHKMPLPNRYILLYLCRFWCEVTLNKDRNHMSLKALAIVVSPSLFSQKQ